MAFREPGKTSPGDLLTPLDAAKLIGVSTDSVRVYADKGTLPAIRTPSGRRLFRRSDVDAFAELRRQGRAH